MQGLHSAGTVRDVTRRYSIDRVEYLLLRMSQAALRRHLPMVAFTVGDMLAANWFGTSPRPVMAQVRVAPLRRMPLTHLATLFATVCNRVQGAAPHGGITLEEVLAIYDQALAEYETRQP